MNASPITNWEGAQAYFMFADNPTMLTVILGLAVTVTVGTIIASYKHEQQTYIDYQ